MSCAFLHLPNELITAIICHLEDIDTLRRLARTCSRLQSLTEPSLYQSIFHRTGEAAINLCKAIDARPARANGIQTIDSRCKWQKRDGLVFLASVISQAQNLREVAIESPYCKNAYGKEKTIWTRTMDALVLSVCHRNVTSGQECSQLKRLTLHLSGAERFWNVHQEISAIFAHPTLQELTISCAELHEDSLQKLKSVNRTPLQQLILIECNLTVEALYIVLSIPRSLEELNLGENCNHTWLNSPQFRRDRPRFANKLCSSSPEAFFSSLDQQKDSLRNLTYIVKGPSLSQVDFPESCNGLSKFYQLQNITLDGYCPLFERALTFKRTAPPNLVSLTAKGDMFRLQCNPNLSLAEDYQSHVSWTIAAASISDHLQNVHLVSSRTFTNVSKNHREAVTQLGRAFIDRQVNMQLSKRTYHGNIPPFLFEEQECTEDLVYDTDNGFCEELRASGDRAMNDIDF